MAYELLTALFERETRYGAARLIVAGAAAGLAAFAGFGGLEGLYLVCVVAGIVAGSLWALPVVPVVAVLPALFVDTGLGFHGDAAGDYLMAAAVVVGGGALAALAGVLVWATVAAAHSRTVSRSPS